ncbi:MAG: hypothetical protein H6977_12555 [Gammaproteobacteria bacterium]|nr:hypothetical protein [Gammaproteobacteria bacterium]MCP5200838.1 hypothetical protein [Gammaproteobacteria bacterium]
MPQRHRLRRLAGAAWIALLIATPPAPACDSDADCGPGGTCIKREKRASGVCYGRASDTPAPPVTPDAGTVAPRPVTGERRERAKAWLGDPEAIIEQELPGHERGGTCMVTQDCPAGFECVLAGFEGRCVKL